MGADNQKLISKSGNGGKRPGAGRPLGSKHRATPQQKQTLSEMAREYTNISLQTLVDVATNGTSESARVSAASILLDRGYGKAVQAMSHENPDGSAMSGPVLNLTVTRPDG